jgi:hypothetical protein
LTVYDVQMVRKKTILTTAEIEKVRQRAIRAVAPLRPPEQGRKYNYGDKRTEAGRRLPEYYLVYFLLVELLRFPHGGRWEKVAWTIPVDFNGRAALIEHRKFGVGVFSPATGEYETTAAGIVAAVVRGVEAARSFFDHLAAEAVGGSRLNVKNNCAWLFGRYTYLRDQFRQKTASVTDTSLYKLPDGIKLKSLSELKFSDMQEARWLGIAAIEAFFGWMEHVLIHIAILLGNIGTGQDVARLAQSEWSEKVKAVIDLSSEKETKAIYEDLLEVRRQVRNYIAHGAFGKHGEAFQFHSATGAVPVNLTDPQGNNKFSMWSVPSFDEAKTLEVAESFVTKLWEGNRAPAKLYLEGADLPVILSYAVDGTYASAMSSEEAMEDFVKSLTHEIDNAANMDW